MSPKCQGHPSIGHPRCSYSCTGASVAPGRPVLCKLSQDLLRCLKPSCKDAPVRVTRKLELWCRSQSKEGLPSSVKPGPKEWERERSCLLPKPSSSSPPGCTEQWRWPCSGELRQPGRIDTWWPLMLPLREVAARSEKNSPCQFLLTMIL